MEDHRQSRREFAAEPSRHGAQHRKHNEVTVASHIARKKTNSISRVAVPGGVLAYRQELRRKAGAYVAAAAVVVGVIGVLLIALPGRITGLIGFALIIAAFPLMVAFGIPLSIGVVSITLGAVTSLALWFALGQWAAHRATKEAVADWRDWWRTMWPLALAMALGGGGGFVLFVLGVL
jgi:polyferredoxin